MSEQLTLGIEVPEISEEERFYNTYLLPRFLNCVEHEAAAAEFLSFREGAGFSSIYFGGTLMLRLHLRGKRWYICVPRGFERHYPDAMRSTMKADGTMIRVHFARGDELKIAEPLIYCLEETIQKYPKDIGCCSHYVECSDALRCIQRNPRISMACIYRKNLKAGKVFYGKNKNI